MITSNIKVQLNCDKDVLWNVITNNTDYSWRSDVSKIEIVDQTHFIEYAKNGYPTYFTVTKKEERKEYRFSMKNTNISGNWIGIFTPLENGRIELDFTEEIEVTNFIMKVFAKPYLRKQQHNYIKDLKQKLQIVEQ